MDVATPARDRLLDVVLDQDAWTMHSKIEARCWIWRRTDPGEVRVAPALPDEGELRLGSIDVGIAHELLHQQPQQALLRGVELAGGNALEALEARLAARPGDDVVRGGRADDRHLLL